MSQCGGAWLGCAQVKDTGFVITLKASQQTVPIVGAKERPGGESANRNVFAAKLICALPGLHQPANLLISSAAEVALGNCEFTAVAPPDFEQDSVKSSDALLPNAHGANIRVALTAIAADYIFRIALDTMVEEALTGDVVVDANNVGSAGIRDERVEFVRRSAVANEIGPKRMSPVEAASQEVEAKPAPVVVELGLILKRRGAVGMADIFGLNQPCIGPDAANGTHALARGFALSKQSADESGIIAAMRVPMSVQGAEAR